MHVWVLLSGILTQYLQNLFQFHQVNVSMVVALTDTFLNDPEENSSRDAIHQTIDEIEL